MTNEGMTTTTSPNNANDPEHSPPEPVQQAHNDDNDRQHHTHGGRLHRLLHPSGKVFHIVRSPHEIDQKRKEVLEADPKASDFDVVVHGTEEHINAVRDCHVHHAKSRDDLYARHEDVLSRYERVRSELDALSKELRDLTDHAVSLEASFDKWGRDRYSAHLRTHGDSETSSLDSGSGVGSSDVSRHEDRTLTALKFFKAPVVRQYFHKGLIWRSPRAGEVVSFELFVDLVYVAVIDALGEVAVLQASAASFLHYTIVFCISSKVFNDILLVMNWFEINDIFSRLCILFILICLYSFASNTEYLFEYTYTAGISFYLASRFFVAAWFCLVAFLTPMVRWNMVYHAVIATSAAVLWIGSIHIEYPMNLPLIWIAIVFDLFGSTIFVPIIRLGLQSRPKSRFFTALTEYLPAINIEHRVERTGAFVSLVIGYSIIKIFFQSHASFPLNAFLGKGILGLIQAFIINWIYFEIDAWGIHVHAIRRHRVSTGVWNLAHIPFSAAFILAASTLSELVIAHDCSDADPHDLGEAFAKNSIGELEPALRWFYCGGLGVALLSMTAISLTHVHKRLPSPKLTKRTRLLYRTCIAIAVICLPLAGHHLTSLSLIATTTCLTASILIVDIFGLSCSGDNFFTGAFCEHRKKQTRYTARCRISEMRKRAVREMVERGDKVEIEDVIGLEGRERDGNGSVSSGETRVGDVDRGAGGY